MAKKHNMMMTLDDTIYDKIQAYYINPDKFPLSEKHEEIRQRWISVMTLQLKGFSKFKIANMMVKNFELSQAQAYIDIRNAENVFGNINKTDAEAFKQIWLEWCKELRLRSQRKGDLKAEAKVLDMMAKYGGLDSENPEFNPEKLENKEIHIVLPKNMIEMIKSQLQKGNSDFNDLNVTDIDFEDIK